MSKKAINRTDNKTKMRAPFHWRTELRLAPGYLTLTMWVVFSFVLIGWIFAASLATSKEIFQGKALALPSGLHFENYVKAWTNNKVSSFFLNSLLYASITSVLLIFLAAPAAYAMSRFKFFLNRPLQNGFVAAMAVPVVMIILPLFSVVTDLQLLKQDITIRLLMIFLFTGYNIPYTSIFLLAFFSNLSRSYEEAAAIDGCSSTKAFWKIMLPLAQPGIVTVTIFNFINIWNEYFMSLIFASGDRVRPVAVGVYGMIESMRYTGDWAGMFASVVIVFLPTFVLFLFLSERIIQGVTGGGVKG